MISRRRVASSVPVLCCHRGALSATGRVGPGMLAAHSHSFVNRPGWREFQVVLAGLRRDRRFVVLLNDKMGEPQAVEVLCHEWAHAVAWNFAVDRLINAPDTDPVAFERACHDEKAFATDVELASHRPPDRSQNC